MDSQDHIEGSKKSLLKKQKKKLLLQSGTSNMFLNLVEEWKKKVPSALFTITLAKVRHAVKDDDNNIVKEEIFKVTDTHIPRTSINKKLSADDELWSYMPYKSLTPAQKYKKYKKIMNKIKKQDLQEKINKYIKSTKKALQREKSKQVTKSDTLLRDIHLVVQGKRLTSNLVS